MQLLSCGAPGVVRGGMVQAERGEEGGSTLDLRFTNSKSTNCLMGVEKNYVLAHFNLTLFGPGAWIVTDFRDLPIDHRPEGGDQQSGKNNQEEKRREEKRREEKRKS